MPHRIVGYLYHRISRCAELGRAFGFKCYARTALAQCSKSARFEGRVQLRNAAQIAIGENCLVKGGTILNGRSRSSDIGVELRDETYIKEFCYIDAYGGSISIAGCCAVGQFVVIAGQGGVQIGRYVMIGAHAYILSSNHVFASKEFPFILQGDKLKRVVIEDNVWLGGGSIVMPGVTIGRNSVIGAGSVVATNVPPNSVYTSSRSDISLSPIRFKVEEQNESDNRQACRVRKEY